MIPLDRGRRLYSTDCLAKSYGRHHRVLDGVAFALHPGQILALVGPNGAGKTTLLSVLAGILPQSEGTIAIDGTSVDFDREPEKRRELGVVLGGMALVDDLRPPEYFEFIASLNAVPRATASDRAGRLVRRFSLEGHNGKRIRDLSTGTRKKVELIAALLHQPRILLLDEPFEALDPPSAAEFTAVVRDYVGQHGAAAIVSSHILPWVEPLATGIRFLWNGRLYARHDVEALVAASPEAEELRGWAEVLAA